jgi:hypothetical protein
MQPIKKQLVSDVAQQARDGFDTFDDAIESDDAEQASSSSPSSSIIRGNQLKFGDATTPFKWLDKSTGKPFSLERALVAIDLWRVMQKWPPQNDKSPPATRILAPDEKFPDVDKLNAETPKDEWRTGPDGKPKGPYENAFVLYLLDAETMQRYTYVASTIGGKRAVRELRDRVDWMRKFRGSNVYPAVVLADVFMTTDYGGRPRPHFEIMHWIQFGDAGTPLPAPEQRMLTVEADEPPTPKAGTQTAKSPTQKTGARKVKPPTLSEELDDELPW